MAAPSPVASFLALSLAVIVAVALCAHLFADAVRLIGLLAALACLTIAVWQLTGGQASRREALAAPMARFQPVAAPERVWGGWAARGAPGRRGVAQKEGFHGGPGGPGGRKEGFLAAATTAPPGGSLPSFPNIPPSLLPSYPGAIDFDYLETAPALGHSDRLAATAATTPYGNPYQDTRLADPQAAPPCVDDDALQYFDCDELNTYQVRSRNVPERVWAGVFRRKALVGRYLAEELEEAEQIRWWGLPEY